MNAQVYHRNTLEQEVFEVYICLYNRYGFSKIKNIKANSEEFKENFDVSINNISVEDYIYIDHKINEYFMIYYFETSNNTLYYFS